MIKIITGTDPDKLAAEIEKETEKKVINHVSVSTSDSFRGYDSKGSAKYETRITVLLSLSDATKK